VKRTFESPFLDEHVFERERAEPWEPSTAKLASESPFAQLEGYPENGKADSTLTRDEYAQEAEFEDEHNEGEPSTDELDAVDPASNEYEAFDPAANEYPFSFEFSDTEVDPSVDSAAAEIDTELFQRLMPLGAAVERALLAAQIALGKRNQTDLTDFVFFFRHPELKGTRLGKGQETLMAEWLQIRDQLVRPALIKVATTIARPGASTPSSAPPAPAPGRPSAPSGDPSRDLLYDGTMPAPGTVETRRSYRNNPPVTGDPSNRSRMLYDNVINQFAVGVNPRYKQKFTDGKITSTYCNIFSWDVTRAMGAEIPHWVDSAGERMAPLQGSEISANATNDWLHKHGSRHGWRKVADPGEAQALANDGHPVVASWKNLKRRPNGRPYSGHIAIVRPGNLGKKGPHIAQAGAKNFNTGDWQSIVKPGTTVELWAAV
jgi:hypothetical protein